MSDTERYDRFEGDERRWSAAAEVRDLQSTWERQFSASAELP